MKVIRGIVSGVGMVGLFALLLPVIILGLFTVGIMIGYYDQVHITISLRG